MFAAGGDFSGCGYSSPYTDDTCPCATGLDMTRTGVKAIGRKVYLYVYPTIGSCIGSSDVDYW